MADKSAIEMADELLLTFKMAVGFAVEMAVTSVRMAVRSVVEMHSGPIGPSRGKNPFQRPQLSIHHYHSGPLGPSKGTNSFQRPQPSINLLNHYPSEPLGPSRGKNPFLRPQPSINPLNHYIGPVSYMVELWDH